MKRNLLYHLLFLTALGLFCFSGISNAQIENFMVGTTTRKMLVYAPSTIVPGRPLLLSMHGYNQDINYQKNQTQWETIAKENNFVVVYPGGINNSWDISGNTDIDFILAIIDEMVKRYGIDRDRVYLSGFSMGGMFTYFAATKIADKIAAFAPVSGYLMGGSNTNSSRPIPIIHIHGTSDDVVTYSGVLTCLSAWATRDGCPATAQVTPQYPVGKTTGDKKYYWGPGIDSVEIVHISLNGKGHWHSIDVNGVNSSQEIWDFCKKFSLGFGIPKFKAASVNGADPKKILVSFTKPLKKLTNFEGFTVKIDGVVADIDTIVRTDSVHLSVMMANNILNNNEIKLSYSNGNVVSVYDKKLVDIKDTLVDNQLYGSSPKFTELAITKKGDTLIARFNKKMLLPSDITSMVLKADFNGKFTIPLQQCSFLNNDSSTLAFPLGDTVYADYKLILSYTGTTIKSADGGLLKIDTAFSVTNNSLGLPVHIVSGVIDESAIAISLTFSKPMSMTDSQINQLSLKVNGKAVAIKEVFNLLSSIRINLFSNLKYGDTIKVTYTPGNITAKDKGALEVFTDFAVENTISEPTYAQVPGKIEAENYTMQFGTDTETTSDAGGGINVGWTETGDWLLYAIENKTDSTDFMINFRLAAQNSGPVFDYYLDDVKIGQIVVPGTGAWQSFRNVIRKISIPKGKHYFKILTVTGGFNVNYLDIEDSIPSEIKSAKYNLAIYPNPATNKIMIKSSGFQYNKIEIADIMGRTVLSISVDYKQELLLPLNLNSGIYVLKLSNGRSIYSQKINIVK